MALPFEAPVERFGATMPVDRSMRPMAVFGPEPVGHGSMMPPLEFVFGPVPRTIVIALIEIWFEPGSRAIKMTPGLIARMAVPDAVPVKILISGSIKFLRPAASIGTAVAASFAFGPGVTG